MTDPQQEPPGGTPGGLRGTVESVSERDDGVVIVVRLTNPQDRALHYIADVRAMKFDPFGRLRVQLSDRGRDMLPGGFAMQPRIRRVDPHSESVATVRLPRTIVKLAEAPAPPGEVVFEERAVADATEIEIEIGWADTPFYRDPRERPREESDIASWEQGSLRLTAPPPRAR